MNIFEIVKQSVTTRQATERYSIRVERNGMCRCPFHDDSTPSMKLDRRYYCFGCAATGDVIDFVSRLRGIGSKEAAILLAQDFAIPYENGAGKTSKPRQQNIDEQNYQHMECYRGPPGSGKTTSCSLLARFYDPQGGSISIGGHDLREFTCDSLLANISMVFQNVYLFHDTIRANLLFGKPGTTEEEMIEAAKRARCHDFIMALPEGYDTVVGEGGGTLSGGEKQRISIARAMLKDAPIVILDEATASINPENEHLIQRAISELTRGKTIITIAHRLATIEKADQILVVDDGKIAERGTHEELIRQEGLYKRFVAIREQTEGWHIA